MIIWVDTNAISTSLGSHFIYNDHTKYCQSPPGFFITPTISRLVMLHPPDFLIAVKPLLARWLLLLMIVLAKWRCLMWGLTVTLLR